MCSMSNGTELRNYNREADSMENTKDDSSTSFETALQELQAIVDRMEKGDQSLEQSLEDFERGINIARECQERLKQAELRVKMLVEKSDGSHEEKPFEPEQSDS